MKTALQFMELHRLHWPVFEGGEVRQLEDRAKRQKWTLWGATRARCGHPVSLPPELGSGDCSARKTTTPPLGWLGGR